MRIPDRRSNFACGNTLVVCLVVTGIVGFLLASYLGLVRSQNVATMRSQAWNATIPVIEAGIEEALAHMNKQLTNDLIGPGIDWEKHGSHYCMRRYIGSHYYEVTISNWIVGITNRAPVIESRGYVSAPLMVAMADGPLIAVMAGVDAERKYMPRGIRCNVRQVFVFTKALAAKGLIELNGNQIESDSYDSLDNSKSSNGVYHVDFRGDKGDIATNSGLTNSLTSGNAKIYGRLSTGPGGSVKIGSTGIVGSEAFHAIPGNAGGWEAGWITDDMNVDYESVTAPYSSAWTPSGPPYVLGDVQDYYLPSLTLNSTTMTVTNHCRLFVQGNVSIQGSGQIIIAPGASLIMYVAGNSTYFGGNGVVNETGTAVNFQYYGLDSNRSIRFEGNGQVTGTIYAPNATLAMKGSGSSGSIYGAAVCKEASLEGNFEFHYDEALTKIGPIRGYIVSRWDEMTAEEVVNKPVVF